MQPPDAALNSPGDGLGNEIATRVRNHPPPGRRVPRRRPCPAHPVHIRASITEHVGTAVATAPPLPRRQFTQRPPPTRSRTLLERSTAVEEPWSGLAQAGRPGDKSTSVGVACQRGPAPPSRHRRAPPLPPATWDNRPVKIASVVGARPQFVKLAPIARQFADAGDIEHSIIHTGQHYDPAMSRVFFQDLGIPEPDVNLGVGSGTHGVQTGAMLSAIESVLEEIRPDWTLVYGDTNSTLAAAIAAVKVHLPLAHLEAGLRSFNRRMPEEHNRVLTDHAADLLLAPTEVAMKNLALERLGDRSVNVGDVMTDICFTVSDIVKRSHAQPPARS